MSDLVSHEAAPRKALSLKPSRLMGSAHCLNCGTGLKGPFCYYCGQPDKNLMRFFPALMREFLEDFLELDSRFTRTMVPLLFIPGKLTRDYLDGRRFRYTPPLRLYIFSSMAFFLLAATLAGNAIGIYNLDNPGSFKSSGPNLTLEDQRELQGVRGALEKLDPKLAADMDREIERAKLEAADGDIRDNEGGDDDDGLNTGLDEIIVGGKPWDRETNPVVIPGIPQFINEWINDEIEKSPQKAKEIEANPNIIVDKMFDVLPITMFILLPVVALLFKFWYLFSGRYYVEHLIHSLHNHSFLFVVLLISLIADSLAGWLEPAGTGLWSSAVTYLGIAISIWIPIYLLISLKRVYQQGWMLTIIKYGLTGISYVVLLAVGSSMAALASFLLL